MPNEKVDTLLARFAFAFKAAPLPYKQHSKSLRPSAFIKAATPLDEVARRAYRLVKERRKNA